MGKLTNEFILDTTAQLFARDGADNFSIRKLAGKLGVVPSVIYYHFADEQILLRSMFDYLNHRLGEKRKALPQPKSARQMLKDRIVFQIDNQEAIVAVLKYYLHYRPTFPRFRGGFVPDKSALHIEEVLHYGVQTGEFRVKNIADDAKVIAHAINGFLLEYFPYVPTASEKRRLVNRIYAFLVRALI